MTAKVRAMMYVIPVETLEVLVTRPTLENLHEEKNTLGLGSVVQSCGGADG